MRTSFHFGPLLLFFLLNLWHIRVGRGRGGERRNFLAPHRLSQIILPHDYTNHHPPFNHLVSPKASFPVNFLKIVSPHRFPLEKGRRFELRSCNHGIIPLRTQAEVTQTLNVETRMTTKKSGLCDSFHSGISGSIDKELPISHNTCFGA